MGPHAGYNVVMVRVEQVIDSWKSIRQDTITAVEEFPAEEFGFRPAPGAMTFGEVARHILDSGDGLTGMMLAGEESLLMPANREKLRLHFRNIPAVADPPALAAALRQSLEERTAALAGQGAGFYAQIITRFDGEKVTRLEMLQAIKEHELSHRAVLFLCLRMKGMVPATTRRRIAKQAAE